MTKGKCPKCGEKFVVEDHLLDSPNFVSDILKDGDKNVFETKIKELEKRIEKISEEPFMVAKVVMTRKDNTAVIVIPNKNKFLVDTKENLKLKVDDEVVCQQSNLRIVSKLN